MIFFNKFASGNLFSPVQTFTFYSIDYEAYSSLIFYWND